MKELIICEKPAQAKEYVNVFTKYLSKPFRAEKGYYTNGDLTISYAIGHLIQLADASIYDPKYSHWNLEHLPIIPESFKYVVSTSTKAQYLVLKSLIKTHSTIYNAADAEREGELIFRLILNQTNENCTAKTIKRIWLTDYQYETVVNCYKNAKLQVEYDNLYDAARARQIADWLIGINATRTLTVASKTNTTLTLGRVQTAILRLIVDRYNKYINFISEDTFTPFIIINNFDLTLNKSFLVLEDAKNIIAKTPGNSKIEYHSETKKVKQPLLFSLTELQVLCNQKHNYTASQTLEFAQKLYENKIISYPRTSSNYLTEALKNDVNAILDFLKENYYHSDNKLDHSFLDNINNHFIFNDSKTSDHYALIPLKHNVKEISKLTTEEKNVFDEIVKIFFKCFSEPAIVEEISLKVNTDNDQIFYYKNFKNIKYKGFLFFDQKEENKENDTLSLSLNKEVIENKMFPITKVEIKKGKTTTTNLFTEATLLQAMKNPTSYEKIEENQEFVKSLGTPATNDKFLPILLKRNYVSMEKKYIVPSELGLKIINALSETKLTSISLTAQIEYELENIRQGKLSYEKFLLATIRYATKITSEIKENAERIGESVKVEDKERIICPCCKKGFLYLAKSKKNYYCSEFKSEPACDFILFTNVFGKKLSASNINDLITKRKTKVMEFTNTKNHKYKAYLILNEKFKIEMAF